jgi:hypothetical protein
MQQELQMQNQAFQRQLMKEQEAEKRETSKQKIASLFNMFSSSMGNLMSNPKLLTKTASLAFCMFGAFHLSKFSMQVLSMALLSKFGKPQLVRETSKIHSNNYFTLPFIYGSKFIR